MKLLTIILTLIASILFSGYNIPDFKSNQTVNPILGDISFENKFRQKPCATTDNEYLVEKTAGREVAEKINSKHQYEKLLDMNDMDVDNWIRSSGFTKE